jgi:cell shape-determining protein MreC
VGPRRLPARHRILAAATAAIAVHMAASRGLEGVRLGVLAALPGLGGPGGILAEPAEPSTDPALAARVDGWRKTRARMLGAEGRVPVAVMAWRPDRQIAVIGAGSDAGLRPSDPVVVPSGLLGFVEAVQPHLARVRLLSAPKARVAVTLAESRPGLPGEIAALNAVLEGQGDGARLVEGPLLTAFRVGDRLVAVGDAAEGESARPLAVGAVTVEGLVPEVRLFAGPGELGLVAVASGRPPPRLFEDRPLEVRAAPLVGGAGALLAGPSAAAITPGCAVLAGGRYVGRVVRVASGGAVASRLSDRGHRVFVRCLGGGDRSWTGELVAHGDGVCRLEGAGAPDAADATVVALTAGGEGLVPADLPCGVLERDGDGWRLRDAGAAWPPSVTVPVFAFPDELKQLLPR